MLIDSAPPASTQVASAGLHLHRGVEHGLQARAAAAVELQPGDGDRQPGVERGDPADRRGVHRRVAVAEHDVVDRVAGQAGALEQRADDGGGQLVRGHVAQSPADRPGCAIGSQMTASRMVGLLEFDSERSAGVLADPVQGRPVGQFDQDQGRRSSTRKVAASVTTMSTGRCAVSG